MTISDIISLLSGISLFLFGMTLMGDGLKRLSGNRLEPMIRKLSDTPLKGLLLGSGVTAVIQSSSATSVLVVGFVNSRMMKVKQAIPIILGAIFGTSITGWVISMSYIQGAGALSDLLSTATLTGFVAVLGILFRLFSKKRERQHLGDILLGFAILMFGMSTMSGSVAGLKDLPWFQSLLTSMQNPLLGILIGALVSAVLQSASAAVGVVQALSVTGGISFAVALPLFMGISIGAALPVMLSALGTNTDGKRTALSYLVASVLGVLVCASIFYIADAIIRFPFMSQIMNPFSLAFVNTIFRLCMIILLFPLVGVLEALVTRMIPEKASSDIEVIPLDSRLTVHPSLALNQSRTVINDMAEKAAQSVSEATDLLWNYSESGFEHVTQLEDIGDQYEDRLGSFLMELAQQNLSGWQSRRSSIFLHTLSDFERISDHALNLAESAKELHEKQQSLSTEAMKELDVMSSAVQEILRLTLEAFSQEDSSMAEHIEPLEDVIDDLCDEMKLHHVERLQNGACSISAGFVFNDLITNYERIADHCSNIAVAIVEISSDSFAAHEDLISVKTKNTEEYRQLSEEFHRRFRLPGAPAPQ